MTSDSKKHVPNSIPKDSQKTVSVISQRGSDSKQIVPEDEVVMLAVQNDFEQKKLEKEVNGPKGLEPTRYGDWESKGRCYDF